MRNFDKIDIVGLVITAFLAGSGLIAVINDNDATNLKIEAIQRGYAEWKLDQETGKTTWQWKEAR